MLAALMLSMIVLTTALFAHALVTYDGERAGDRPSFLYDHPTADHERRVVLRGP